MIVSLLLLSACAPHIEPGPLASTQLEEPTRLIQQPSQTGPNIYLAATIGAGSAYDPSGFEGLANLVAHSLIEGGAGELSGEGIKAALEPTGGQLNVQVDREWVSIRLQCHTDHAQTCTSLFSDLLTKPRFEPTAIDRVRDQALYDITQGMLSSEERLGQLAFDVWTYEGHPYGHPIQGRAGVLPILSIEEVNTFYQQHYVRSNITVGIAGKIDETIISSLNTQLEQLPKTRAPELILPTPAAIQNHSLLIIDSETPLTGFHMGIPYPVGRDHDDWPALWVAFTALGAHRQSFGRLYESIRTQRGLNYGDYAYSEPFVQRSGSSDAEQGVLRRQAQYQFWLRPVSNENAAFTLKMAVSELEMFINDGLNETEFQRIRSYLLGNIPLMAQNPGRRLLFEMDAQTSDTPNLLTGYSKQLEELTLDIVNSAIKAHIQAEALRIVAVGGDAERLFNQLTEETSTPIVYSGIEPDKSQQDQDLMVANKVLHIHENNAKIVKAKGLFQ